MHVYIICRPNPVKNYILPEKFFTYTAIFLQSYFLVSHYFIKFVEEIQLLIIIRFAFIFNVQSNNLKYKKNPSYSQSLKKADYEKNCLFNWIFRYPSIYFQS